MSYKPFDRWLGSHTDPAHVLHFLFEVSTEFPRGEINALFRQQLSQRAAQIGTAEAQQQLMQLHDFDFVGYLARSLRSAGFSDDRIDPLTQDTVVRLLVQPGQLFRGWNGEGPIIARFKVAVKNSIINMAQKTQTRRRRIPATSISRDSQAAMDIPAPKSMAQTLLDEFRAFLLDRHGEQAVQVFDQKVGGGDVKELVGNGITSYGIKELVKKIKVAAREFAADDPEFLGMVEKAFRDEARTVSRRFAGKQS